MILRIFMLWILGALLIIPYSINRLFFHAQPDEYAFLIVVPLFWIFGFWGVVGPMIAAFRIRRLFKALELAANGDEVREAFERHEGKEVIIDLIASENRLPRFLARILYVKIAGKLVGPSPRDQVHFGGADAGKAK